MKLSVPALFMAGLLTGPTTLHAASISYTDYVARVAISIGGTAYACASLNDPTCAFVSITATGDTSNVQAFSVTGASGFKNTLLSAATLNVFFNNGSTPYTADLVTNQLYVSVDQTNGGAGFGSAYGPTYPLATYGSNLGFNTYDLASTFSAQGFAPFVTDPGLFASGATLYTTDGTAIVISYPIVVPLFSTFSSTVTPVTSVPEPATLSLLMLGLAGVGFMRRRAAI